MILLVLILEGCTHRFGVLGAKFENLSHLNSSGMSDWRTANRARISLQKILDIHNDVRFPVTSVVYIFDVVILFAGSGYKVLQSRKLAVSHDGAVVKPYRSRKSANTSALL